MNRCAPVKCGSRLNAGACVDGKEIGVVSSTPRVVGGVVTMAYVIVENSRECSSVGVCCP